MENRGRHDVLNVITLIPLPVYPNSFAVIRLFAFQSTFPLHFVDQYINQCLFRANDALTSLGHGLRPPPTLYMSMMSFESTSRTSGIIHSTFTIHDDVIEWKHFPRYWPFVQGIHRSPVNSPHKGQWRGALMFSLICVWINGWANNREASDLRRYRVHYDVIVML